MTAAVASPSPSAPSRVRLASFDLLKFAAIFLVLWGHAIQHLLSAPAVDNGLFRFISAFHMPLFMTIAGFFSGSATRTPSARFLWRKWCELILPTLVMGVVVILLQKYVVHGSGSVVRLYVEGFWFLKSLFLCFMLYVGANLFGRFRLWALAATLLLSQCVGFVGVGTSGTLLFICGAELLCRRFPSFPGMDTMVAAGAETKGVYIMQLLLLETVMPSLVCLDSLPLWLANWVATPGIALGVLALSLLIVKQINRSPLASLLMLGNYGAVKQMGADILKLRNI